MKFEVQLTGPGEKKLHVVDLQRNSERWSISLDGQPSDADVVEIDPHTLSVILHGQSYEVRITAPAEGVLKVQSGLQEFTAEVADPRAWRGRRHSGLEAQGRQQVVAPMPGKVVRILVSQGEPVEAGQGLLVVEAMKMQNEIRSPKSGIVEKLLIKEGQPVNAGEVLAWVD